MKKQYFCNKNKFCNKSKSCNKDITAYLSTAQLYKIYEDYSSVHLKYQLQNVCENLLLRVVNSNVNIRSGKY